MSQQTDDWIVVFKSSSEFEVEIVRGLLQENGIEARILNDDDSMLDSLNVMKESALLVQKSDLPAATKIIKSTDIE